MLEKEARGGKERVVAALADRAARRGVGRGGGGRKARGLLLRGKKEERHAKGACPPLLFRRELNASLIDPWAINSPKTKAVAPSIPPTRIGTVSLFFLKPSRFCVQSMRREAAGASRTAPATRRGLVTCKGWVGG